MYLKDFVLNFYNCMQFVCFLPFSQDSMAFNIHFLAFILLAVSLRTRIQVVPLTSFHHFLFSRFGCTFSAAVAYNHCRSRVNFLHLTKSKTFIRSRPSKTITLLIIIIIMVIFKCYFSGELIALSHKKNKNKK